ARSARLSCNYFTVTGRMTCLKGIARFTTNAVTAAAFVIWLGGCDSSGTAPSDNAGNTPPPRSTLTIDCTAANPACPEIPISGDAPYRLPDGSTSPVRGYADPSLRRDPATGTLWLAYSWPHLDFTPGTNTGTVNVDSHLARSVDGGLTWQFVRPLWLGVPTVDDVGQSGYFNQETVSLAVRSAPTGSVWYSMRHRYFTRAGSDPRITSFTINAATASSPELLVQAEEAQLGGDLTSAFWRVDFNLASLAADLRGCTFFDPGIIWHNNALYLATQCILYGASGEAPERQFVAVFSTTAQGTARTWTWRYLGKLATYTDAVALGGQTLLQTDLALGNDGTLLAIFSPSRPNTPVADHFGCRVVEIASLDPPRLARDLTGALRVRVVVTATDQLPTGPAACGYDPASATGLLIVRRDQSRNQLAVTLNRTGLKP
ncbi:MAG: sialidase family protein, partial [Gemmatimonadaceae bacterium]